MELSAGEVDLRFHVLLVSPSQVLHAAVRQALQDTQVTVLREFAVRSAVAELERRCTPVLLVSTDSDWRQTLLTLSSSEEQPSIIVLTPDVDAGLWAEAMMLGAFDVLALSSDRHVVLRTIAAAYRRWERRQLVRQALRKNPLLQDVL